MPFTKDNPGKGRPKNAENKEKKTLREAITTIVEGGAEDFQRTMNELSETNPKAYLDIYVKLLNYCMPTMRSVDTQISAKEGVDSIKIEIKKGTDLDT